MMRSQGWLARLLESKSTVYAASAISLLLGLCFVFVLPPHPWGWRGIDQYHELARALARGESFGTTDVPWGYAYYIAAFYALFGEVLWAPLVGQVLLNSLGAAAAVSPGAASGGPPHSGVERAPRGRLLLQHRLRVDAVVGLSVHSGFPGDAIVLREGRRVRPPPLVCRERTARGPRLAVQAQPDSVSVRAGRRATCSWHLFARAALSRALAHAAIYLALVVAALAPWTIRNYRLTGEFLPTSTHGSVQLWYGTLQTGPYLESRAHNPRSAFEAPAFDYTSLADRPLIISATPRECPGMDQASVQIVYWTSRDPARRTRPMRREADGTFSVDVPGQPAPTVVYYFFEATGPTEDGSAGVQRTPPGGDADPYIFAVSGDHLSDLDANGDLLDVFDLIRMLRFLAWSEPLPFQDRLDLDGDGRVDTRRRRPGRQPAGGRA